jgi:hypothetical protein
VKTQDLSSLAGQLETKAAEYSAAAAALRKVVGAFGAAAPTNGHPPRRAAAVKRGPVPTNGRAIATRVRRPGRQKVSDDRILEVLRERKGATRKEAAEACGICEPGMGKRLQGLMEDGRATLGGDKKFRPVVASA